ncbi:MAG: hypothetical protein ACI4JM_03975 [Oscillospiraceae bacterium]
MIIKAIKEKVFVQLFSKSWWGQGAKPLSPSADGETPQGCGGGSPCLSKRSKKFFGKLFPKKA